MENKKTKESDFIKYDDGKLKYSLVPPVFIKSVAQVLTFGATKYSPNNWKKCEDTTRYQDAMMRHWEAWRDGETIAPDSGYSHLWHCATNLCFLIYFECIKTK